MRFKYSQTGLIVKRWRDERTPDTDRGRMEHRYPLTVDMYTTYLDFHQGILLHEARSGKI